MSEATVCIDTDSPFSWFFKSDKDKVFYLLTITDSHNRHPPTFDLFHQWSGGVVEEEERGEESGFLTTHLPPPPNIKTPPRSPKDSISKAVC